MPLPAKRYRHQRHSRSRTARSAVHWRTARCQQLVLDTQRGFARTNRQIRWRSCFGMVTWHRSRWWGPRSPGNRAPAGVIQGRFLEAWIKHRLSNAKRQ